MAAQAAPQMESGTYEIIRKRLDGAAQDLRDRLGQLNQARKEVFGAVETTLLGSTRITTDNNCTPRDMIALGDYFLFGYNVQIGLRSQTELKDVFAVYQYSNEGFQAVGLELLDNEQFARDFQSLYKYYKKTVFSKFAVIGPHLFMKFRVGKARNDFKTFKWLIEGDKLTYVDNRSDHEFHYPRQHEFEWIRCRRDWHRQGLHPHISIEDRVFVETIGGDLTIKVEDNTESGHGIYEEPVANADQTLDDAEIYYASIGHLIILKIKPYDEPDFRFFVFNEKLKEVKRIDALADACILLPDDQGLIFPNGFYLATGEFKQFETQLSNMTFFRRLQAPNGEDVLFIFLNRLSGDHILLHYNLIEQKVATPILCHGYSLFADGRMVFFRGEAEPQRHHALQIWQTPFSADERVNPEKKEHPLFDIGNKSIVRCMAECQSLLKLLNKEQGYANLYVDIVKKASDVLDAYFWIHQETCYAPGQALDAIRITAEGAIEAFEKVTQIRNATKKAFSDVSSKAETLVDEVAHQTIDRLEDFVKYLAAVRELRGELSTTRELRYADTEAIDDLETNIVDLGETLANRCLHFLLQDHALEPYRQKAADISTDIDTLKKGSDAKRLEEKTEQLSLDLEMLIDIVGNLKIDDPTQTTRIIDQISSIFAHLNQLRANIRQRIKELASNEGIAEFKAQLKLLDQTVVNYLGLCDEADKCETYLTKLMVTIEELEGRFSEFDSFLEQLTQKREEIYNAFENRRLALLEARNKRAAALSSAADRLLKGISNRVSKFETLKEIHSYFAADLMIAKVRDIVDQLVSLEDAVKADDIQTQLKTIKEEASRQLKDRNELFADGQNVIQLGEHKFLVNVQSLAPTLVTKDGVPYFHLTGTNFFQEVTDAKYLEHESFWDMPCASESAEVYRAEYLAFLLYTSLAGPDELAQKLNLDEAERLAWIQAFMGPRYDEAYTKGIHDQDASLVLQHLLEMSLELGLLTASPLVRAQAELFWQGFCGASQKARLQATIDALNAMGNVFQPNGQTQVFELELQSLLARFLETSDLFPDNNPEQAANYLFKRLRHSKTTPQSSEAIVMYRGFLHQLEHRHALDTFTESKQNLAQDLTRWYQIVRTWVQSYQTEHYPKYSDFVDEVSVMAFNQVPIPNLVKQTPSRTQVDNMKGEHNRIQKGTYTLDYHAFFERLRPFHQQKVPGFRHFQILKHQLMESFSDTLRLSEFKPKVLSSFVRNQLIDDVYLPLIGNNLAKQMGTAGESKRTDRMGMLLLVSPPGYGKTTLMEYVANRLGVVFMKINGPAIGHEVTSLDPAAAPNASAREELNKLNLALEMGDNMMLYLDDIQHCNPEFLQKFISLCDATRKIEGVYQGRTRTYDLRGKKVCVVMAGNPYTESGAKFQIPDMLANRADTYNLGDMVGANEKAFKLSYIENCLTSNTILSRLAAGSQRDIRQLVHIAETGDREGIDFDGAHSPEALKEYIDVFSKLLKVRDVVLAVNQQYIQSAAQEDAYRTEPPFKLQGSYRNMNKMAAQIVPIMNEDELQKVIDQHYENESQTLTKGAEANLLKFKTMMGKTTEAERQRWQAILTTFGKKQSMLGVSADDKVGQVILQLNHFRDGLQAIGNTLEKGLAKQEVETPRVPVLAAQPVVNQTSLAPETLSALGTMMEKLLQSESNNSASPSDQSSPEHANRSADLPAANHLYKVLQHQFTIMHHWLKPMYEMDRTQNQALEQIQEAMKASIEQHQTLMTQLERYLGLSKPQPLAETTEELPEDDPEPNPPKRRRKKSMPERYQSP